MRALTDADRIRRLMEALAQASEATGRIYFTGGVSAVLLGWRSTTVDVDLKLVPDSDELNFYGWVARAKDLTTSV